MELSELDYELPPELIAQHPATRRDGSRLLVYDRSEQVGPATAASRICLPSCTASSSSSTTRGSFPPGSRSRRRGGRCCSWSRSKAISGRASRGRPGGSDAGRRYGPVELLEHLGEGRWRLRLTGEPAGETPLPPYITEPLADPDRYQTVYARETGSAAAPTAGLHFTPELLGALDVERVTLARRARHVPPGERGAARGAPDPRRAVLGRTSARGSGSPQHRACSPSARRRCACSRRSRAAPRSAVARSSSSLPASSSGESTPAHELPSATLDAARARDGVRRRGGGRRLYCSAVAERYRFYSFGDAMLIM